MQVDRTGFFSHPALLRRVHPGSWTYGSDRNRRQIGNRAVASQHHDRPCLVRRGKPIKPDIAPHHSAGHAASASQSSDGSCSCDGLEYPWRSRSSFARICSRRRCSRRASYQCGTVLFGPAGGLVRCLKQLLVKNDLDSFHRYTCRICSTVYSTYFEVSMRISRSPVSHHVPILRYEVQAAPAV